MRNTVTVTQNYPTFAAACAARDALAHGGLLEYGIDRVDIERLNGRFDSPARAQSLIPLDRVDQVVELPQVDVVDAQPIE